MQGQETWDRAKPVACGHGGLELLVCVRAGPAYQIRLGSQCPTGNVHVLSLLG